MRRFVIADSFWEDLGRIRQVMIQMNYPDGYMQKFEWETENALDSIMEHNEIAPFIDSKYAEPFRKYIYFNHIIFYVAYDKQLRVLRLFHEKEDWLNKL